jgi:hypothetical protein
MIPRTGAGSREDLRPVDRVVGASRQR